MRNPNRNKVISGPSRKDHGLCVHGSLANHNMMVTTHRSPQDMLVPYQMGICKHGPYLNYNTYIPSRDGPPSTPEYLLGKNDICKRGNKIVKGASHGLSKVLRARYKEVIAIKTDLEARPINQDTKLLLDSIEKTIRIVKRFCKRIKDLPYDHQGRKFIESLKWSRMIISDQAKARVQKVSKPAVSPPNFHRTPRVREFRYSTLSGLNQAPFMVDTCKVFNSAHLLLPNNSYTYSPNAHEEKICLEFIALDEKTQVSKEERSIEVEHPLVSIIGNYAINAFNTAFEQHVKSGEQNKLRHFEFLECKFLKFVTGYHFDMTIEAFEEGYIGTYRTEVIWNIDICAITVCTFLLTNRKPFGTKALAVYYLSHMRPLIFSVNNLYDSNVYRLNRIGPQWGPVRGTAYVEVDRITRLRDKTIEGLKQRQYQDIKLFYPTDCYRPAKQDGCSHPAASTGMVRRSKDTTTYGYDFYNPTLYSRFLRD